MTIENRVKTRIPEIDNNELDDMKITATDRIRLRVEEKEFPEELGSIAVEIICAMYRRKYHEGIKSEGVDSFNVSFIDDLLKEYEDDLAGYMRLRAKEQDESAGVLRFL